MAAQAYELSDDDFKTWKSLGKKVKFRPCFEVEQTVLNDTFCDSVKKWLVAQDKLEVDSLSEAKKMARDEARKHGTGKYCVYAVVDGVMVEIPTTCVKGDVNVEDRVEELADEFVVSEQLVWSLYDMMPGELYDGIVTELEDAQHDMFYKDLFED